MFIKRLFCFDHQWKKIGYTEYKMDDGVHVAERITIFQCVKCGKKREYRHPMPSDYGLNPVNYPR